MRSLVNFLPVVSAVLDELVERLQETVESAICASEKDRPKHLAKTRFQSHSAVAHVG